MFKNEIHKKVIWKSCLLFFLTVSWITCNAGEIKMVAENKNQKKRILLIGASIGKAWNIEDLPERIEAKNYLFEFINTYGPDKSDILESVLNRKENAPDVIIIKQCAAYFRADSISYDHEYVNKYKQFAQEWIFKMESNDITPILATVVPITEKMPYMVKFKRYIKKYILQKDIPEYYRNIRLKGIIAYNDWVKDYAKKKAITVLDLETAVRVSEEDRYLNADYSTDGLHLNEKGYNRLDPMLLEAVKKSLKKRCQ